MFTLAQIFRYPVKGLTPELLTHTVLRKAGGLPFDRGFAFTSGNLPNQPAPGGWVPARTFLQMTVYPGLAAFRANFDDASGILRLTAPDGRDVSFEASDASAAREACALLAGHFETGEHGPVQFAVQAPGHGHWDFTDTGVSLINLASVRQLAETIGQPLDPRRFRGNLYIDGLEPWTEFSLVGKRLRVGEAEIEITRPAMRCAATSADPDTGTTALNVPVALRKATGHIFCGVYGRVVKGGQISAGEGISDLGPAGFNPSADLPPRTAPVTQWPRPVKVLQSDGVTTTVQNATPWWPLPSFQEGDKLLIHNTKGGTDPRTTAVVQAISTDNCFKIRVVSGNSDASENSNLLVSGLGA